MAISKVNSKGLDPTDFNIDDGTLVVDSTNNRVGVGTATPNTLLDVESNTASEIRAVRDGGRSVNIYADGVNAILGYNTGELRIGETTSTISSNFTERMRIDSSGNVGIGTTPEDWYAGFSTKALQLGGTTSLWSLSNGSTDLRTTIDNNLYVSAAGTNTYLNTGPVERYQMINGTHRWSVAASGTADTAATVSEVMRLTSSGLLMASGYQINSNGGRIFSNSFYFTGGGTQTVLTLGLGEAYIFIAQVYNYGGTDFRHGSIFYAARTTNGSPSTTIRSGYLSTQQGSSAFSISGADVQYYGGGGNPTTTIYMLRLI